MWVNLQNSCNSRGWSCRLVLCLPKCGGLSYLLSVSPLCDSLFCFFRDEKGKCVCVCVELMNTGMSTWIYAAFILALGVVLFLLQRYIFFRNFVSSSKHSFSNIPFHLLLPLFGEGDEGGAKRMYLCMHNSPLLTRHTHTHTGTYQGVAVNRLLTRLRLRL